MQKQKFTSIILGLILLSSQSMQTTQAAQTRVVGSYIPGLSYEHQTYNNCGPAALSSVLAAYGIGLSQEAIRKVLRPGTGYMGVEGIDPFLRNFGLRAPYFKGGRLEHLKRVLDLGAPILVLQWLEGSVSAQGFSGRIPHFRVVRGYDENAQVFWVSDSMLGANAVIPYSDFVQLWQVYNNAFMPIVPREMMPQLERTLASIT